jgi:hypothetical protein
MRRGHKLGMGTHEARILWALQAAYPSWTPAPALSKISLQYNARIYRLRDRGWQIESRVQVVNGVRNGSFRLARPGSFPNPRPQPSHSPKAKNKITEASQPVALPSDNLFGESLMPDRSYRE